MLVFEVKHLVLKLIGWFLNAFLERESVAR